MRSTTIRFGASIWARLQEEANKEGVSAASYVRDLVIVHFARMDAQKQSEQASRDADE